MIQVDGWCFAIAIDYFVTDLEKKFFIDDKLDVVSDVRLIKRSYLSSGKYMIYIELN